MAYYDKKLGVWLPKISDVITPTIEIENPKEIEEKIKNTPTSETIVSEPTIDEIFDATTEIVYKPEVLLVPDELTPEEKTILIAEKEAQIKALEEPYRYEVDEDDVEWWICNLCEKAYNSETVQKRHQTLKHK